MTKLSKAIYAFFLSLIISIIFIEFTNNATVKHPNAGLSVEELVRANKYPIETHHVATEDGYIITLHRIPFGRQNNNEKRIPILLMHGAAHSSFNFVQMGANTSISYLLADKGYDVWLGNARGNTWSRKHIHLDPNTDAQYWDFSVHEIGAYDLPASIDYILHKTGYESLHYLGYSQGTTIFFIMGAVRPEYLSKIKLMTAFAPAIYMEDPGSPFIKTMASSHKLIENVATYFNAEELFGRNSIEARYFEKICDENSVLVELCFQQLFLLFGYSPNGISKRILSLEFSQSPAGLSKRQMLHMLQMIDSGDFQQYDYGTAENLKKYNQEKPTIYDLSKIETPVAIYYSTNDRIINVKNVEKLQQVLPNVVHTYQVPSDTFNHYDFLTAENVVPLLYNQAIQQIENY